MTELELERFIKLAKEGNGRRVLEAEFPELSNSKISQYLNILAYHGTIFLKEVVFRSRKSEQVSEDKMRAIVECAIQYKLSKAAVTSAFFVSITAFNKIYKARINGDLDPVEPERMPFKVLEAKDGRPFKSQESKEASELSVAQYDPSSKMPQTSRTKKLSPEEANLFIKLLEENTTYTDIYNRFKHVIGESSCTRYVKMWRYHGSDVVREILAGTRTLHAVDVDRARAIVEYAYLNNISDVDASLRFLVSKSQITMLLKQRRQGLLEPVKPAKAPTLRKWDNTEVRKKWLEKCHNRGGSISLNANEIERIILMMHMNFGGLSMSDRLAGKIKESTCLYYKKIWKWHGEQVLREYIAHGFPTVSEERAIAIASTAWFSSSSSEHMSVMFKAKRSQIEPYIDRIINREIPTVDPLHWPKPVEPKAYTGKKYELAMEKLKQLEQAVPSDPIPQQSLDFEQNNISFEQKAENNTKHIAKSGKNSASSAIENEVINAVNEEYFNPENSMNSGSPKLPHPDDIRIQEAIANRQPITLLNVDYERGSFVVLVDGHPVSHDCEYVKKIRRLLVSKYHMADKLEPDWCLENQFTGWSKTDKLTRNRGNRRIRTEQAQRTYNENHAIEIKELQELALQRKQEKQEKVTEEFVRRVNDIGTAYKGRPAEEYWEGGANRDKAIYDIDSPGFFQLPYPVQVASLVYDRHQLTYGLAVVKKLKSLLQTKL